MQYEILGHEMQALSLSLEVGEKVFGEAGTLLYMTDGIKMDTVMGTGQDAGLLGNLLSGVKRAVSGSGLFVTTFESFQPSGKVVFSAPYPGKIVPLNLAETGDIICQRDAFLCSEMGTDINVVFTKRLGAGFFGGEGFILQRLSGHKTVFIHASGTLLSIDLAANESIRVDPGCLVAMTNRVDYDVQMAPGIKTMLFGGEGFFQTVLRGPGRVFLQTLPLSRLSNRLLGSSFGRSSGSGSLVEQVGGGLMSGIFGND